MKKCLVFLMLTLFLSVCQIGSPNVYGQSNSPLELKNSLRSHRPAPKRVPKKQKPSKHKPSKHKPSNHRPSPRGHYRPNFNNRSQLRQDSRSIINRTASVLREAQFAARKNRYAQGLSKAFAHQEQARRLHVRGEYRQAIFHSMRARNIAYNIVEKNGFSRRQEHDWDDVDYGYMPHAPKDNELDVKIRSDKSDNESIYIRLKLDLD